MSITGAFVNMEFIHLNANKSLLQISKLLTLLLCRNRIKQKLRVLEGGVVNIDLIAKKMK